MKELPPHLARSLESSRRRPSPVVALTILRGAKSADDQILTVVRNPDTNLTHPDVISVPTQRLPEALLASLLERAVVRSRVQRQRRGGTETLTIFRDDQVDNAGASGHDPVVYAVESLLARKLGLAEALENDALRYQAWLGALLEGRAQYPSLITDAEYLSAGRDASSDAQEAILMLNIAVRITEGADLFPESTGSYNLIRWSDRNLFRRMTADRDPAAIGLDMFRFCVDGLCVDSSDAFLQAAGRK